MFSSLLLKPEDRNLVWSMADGAIQTSDISHMRRFAGAVIMLRPFLRSAGVTEITAT